MPKRTKPGSKTFESKPNPAPWRNRIVGYGEEAPSQLVAHDKNWRIHTDAQRAALGGVLREVGVVQNVIINRTTGKLLDGHLRVEMAIAEGCPTVPITYVELTEAEERLILATLDPLSAMAVTDQDLLAGLVGELNVSDEAIQALLNELAGNKPKTGLTDDDDAPALPAEPVSKLGDIWLCGPHRILCGDSTDAEAVARLCVGAKADLVFSDPPYNCAYQGYTEDKLTIQGDRMSEPEFKQFLGAAFRSFRIVVKPGASLYICHPSSFQREFQNALEAAGFEVRCQIIWAKNTFAWGFGRYKFQHEPLFYCHVADQSDPWYGDKAQSTLWEEKKPAANRLHPMMKPVELVDRAIANSSKAGDLVIDLFGGAGSTLIACEKRSRAALLMELDPKYVDVIVQRWQQFTGKEAALEGDGRTFAAIAKSRAAAVSSGTGVGTETTP
jgi:DNA modification methylase